MAKREFSKLEKASGLDRLAPYITDNDYNSIVSWVTEVGRNDPKKFMSESGISRAEFILKSLLENGYNYTVSRDSNLGQIKARITGTTIDIRLTDTYENEGFIGRIYDGGHQFYYTTNYRTIMTDSYHKPIQVGGKPAQWSLPYNNPTNEEVIDLLNFVMGKPMQRSDAYASDGEFVGNVGQMTKNVKGRSGYTTSQQELSYFEKSNSGFSAAIKPYGGGDYINKYGYEQHYSPNPNYFVMVRCVSDKNNSVGFQGVSEDELSEAMREYLTSAIASARETYANAIGLEELIELSNEHKGDEDFTPDFSGDETIASMQRRYWNVLTKDHVLLRPTRTVEEYEEDLGLVGSNNEFAKLLMSDIEYQGTPEENVREHLEDTLNYYIGTYDVSDEDGLRFNPIMVANYMTSDAGLYGNLNKLSYCISNLDIDIKELRGEDFDSLLFKDKLLKFDEATSRRMSATTSDFMQSIASEIKQAVEATGCVCDDNDILIDNNGVVKYTAKRIRGAAVDGSVLEEFTGYIGQIFEPDGLNLVETKFAASNNYLFVPGYEATIVPESDANGHTVAERTRLTGYKESIINGIRYNIRHDILDVTPVAGTTTSLNNVYRQLYNERYDLDYLQQCERDGMPFEFVKAKLDTLSRRVKYPNVYKSDSTMTAEYRDKIGQGSDGFDFYAYTGKTNMAIIDETNDGYFDPVATGTGTNQGIVRYLVEGAKVDNDGRIIRSSEDDRCPLLKQESLSTMSYDAIDRQVMTFGNLMHSKRITEPVQMAAMTFGGWTMDDGFVVSKEFAESYMVADSNGNMRPIKVGDKISDIHGNKGVISLVVDKEMSDKEASDKGLLEEVKWFRANPNLSVVGAPFAPTSRFNAGSAREAMMSPHDLHEPDGTVHEGCIGEARFIITDMTVDEKTHIYDEEEILAGNGRSASSQLAWALASLDAKGLIREFYGNNNSNIATFREMLISFGLDISETGELSTVYQPHEGETRTVFKLPELQYNTRVSKTGKESKILDMNAMRNDFEGLISRSGGFMEVPFDLEYPTGKQLMELTSDKKDINYAKDSWEVKPVFNEDGTIKREGYIAHRNSSLMNPDTVYGLPVLSSYLRSGRMFEGEDISKHDYTRHYENIFTQSIRYLDAKAKGDEKKMTEAKSIAQSSFDKINNDLIHHRFKGKYNFVKHKLMSNRLPNSCTAVWTADPRLDIDQVRVSNSIAFELGVADGDDVVIWRDPILRSAGVASMKCVIDDSIDGIAINPVSDKRFDGDFDGDTVAVVNPTSFSGRKDAKNLLSIKNNLLDKGYTADDGKYDVFINTGLDIAGAVSKHSDLKKRFEVVREHLNEADSLSGKERSKVLNTAVRDLNTAVHSCFARDYGTYITSFNGVEDHIKSIEEHVLAGAKGSIGKLCGGYATYLGVEVDTPKEGERIDVSSIVDHGSTLTTRDMSLDVQRATAVKSFGTGLAGACSQRGVAAMRNENITDVLELTYPVTQAILQSKHDAIDAIRRFDIVAGPLRSLWRGQSIERMADKDGNLTWRTTIVNKEPVRLTRDEFVEQFTDLYTSKDGLSVPINIKKLNTLADNMIGPDGYIIPIDDIAMKIAPMDKLAYGGDFSTLVELCEHNVNLFDGGEYSELFRPQVVRANVAAKSEGKSVKGFGKSDVKNNAKASASKNSKVVTYKKRTKQKSIDVLDEQASEGYNSNVVSTEP